MQPTQSTPCTNGTPRLAGELLAMADALHHLRTALNQMIHDGHTAALMPEASIVLVKGLDVAGALESLAERLAINNDLFIGERRQT